MDLEFVKAIKEDRGDLVSVVQWRVFLQSLFTIDTDWVLFFFYLDCRQTQIDKQSSGFQESKDR